MRKYRQRTRLEPTIALINVVFLMLIFFMVAGTLSQPLDKDVTLVRTADLEGRAPPDTLVVHSDGRLTYRGESVGSVQSFYTARPENEREVIRVVPDAELSALTLVNLARDLRAEGASRVMIVTQRGLDE
ncbi:Biopolymer transport protein ExbD/TolR [Roseovarius albus]|uniref:Biopolymer transport protein ExbD/TolR n=1 Tax=Roseovarius albus TaxID=1247867 RepID=A0A1X6ZPU0_9RHOB|nr:biopolymer transporter ExbD [Roseovarius albus]SLN58176.1 Biopolymer transport protein ExbD/TolR [Roseovarius albus]